MQAKITRIGDWNGFRRMAANLEKDLYTARTLCLKRWGLKAEAVAKSHITEQDLLGNLWQPLAPYTILKKSLQGYSLDVLIETGHYLQSITTFVMDDTCYVGVRKSVTTARGDEYLADIARNNEFGVMSINLPARPLWQPTFYDTMEWHIVHNRTADIFLNLLRQKYSFK